MGMEKIIMPVEFWRGKLNSVIWDRKLDCTIHLFSRDSKSFLKTEFIANAVIKMKVSGSACPLQYDGTVNGFNAYYRSRHGSWSFEIYEGELFESEIIFFREGDDTSIWGGYPDFIKAEEKIMKLSRIFARKHKQIKEKNENNN